MGSPTSVLTPLEKRPQSSLAPPPRADTEKPTFYEAGGPWPDPRSVGASVSDAAPGTVGMSSCCGPAPSLRGSVRAPGAPTGTVYTAVTSRWTLVWTRSQAPDQGAGCPLRVSGCLADISPKLNPSSLPTPALLLLPAEAPSDCTAVPLSVTQAPRPRPPHPVCLQSCPLSSPRSPGVSPLLPPPHRPPICTASPSSPAAGPPAGGCSCPTLSTHSLSWAQPSSTPSVALWLLWQKPCSPASDENRSPFRRH